MGWSVHTATLIRDNEQWLREEVAEMELQAAMAKYTSHLQADAEMEEALARISYEEARASNQAGSE